MTLSWLGIVPSSKPEEVAIEDPDATAYIAALSGTYSQAQRDAINQFFIDLKTNGTWAALDEIVIFAMQTEADALIGLKTATTAFTNSFAIFTAGSGFTCSSGPNRYIQTNFNPSTAAQYSQDSATIFYDIVSGAPTDALECDVGSRVSGGDGVLCGVNTFSARVGENLNNSPIASGGNAVSSIIGSHAFQRTTPSNIDVYTDGVLSHSVNRQSSGVPTLPFYIGAFRLNNNPSLVAANREYSIFAVGSAAVNVATLHTAWNALKAVL